MPPPTSAVAPTASHEGTVPNASSESGQMNTSAAARDTVYVSERSPRA
jgi:hypothetical protein